MIDKSLLKNGKYLYHKMLGGVSIDDSCITLNEIQSEPDSCFVVHDGEIKEVSLSLLRFIGE